MDDEECVGEKGEEKERVARERDEKTKLYKIIQGTARGRAERRGERKKECLVRACKRILRYQRVFCLDYAHKGRRPQKEQDLRRMRRGEGREPPACH